jgi:hypothetical protein
MVPLRQLLNRSINGFHASRLAHSLGAEIGMAASTVPIALERLGVERDLDTPLLGNTDKEEARHPEVVTHSNALTGTNLELPLRGHHFGIDTADVNARIEAGAVVGFNEITGKHFPGTFVVKEKN